MATPQTLAGTTIQALQSDYDGFIEKFKPKKTTDDCYTPDYIYSVVAEYVTKRYGIPLTRFVRPFWPGADYQAEEYPADCVVVDNPPFSIMAEILHFYNAHGVKFFLFAHGLNTFTAASTTGCACICTGFDVTYENGAKIPTSFVTNLEPGIRCRTAPDLYDALDTAQRFYMPDKRPPVYSYPLYLVTAARLNWLSKYGARLSIPVAESEYIRAMDAQRAMKKTVFGNGFLISEKAAAERAAAEKAAAERAAAEKAAAHVWELSEREREIVRRLSHDI